MYQILFPPPRWRFSAASIFSLAKERLEPLLNEAKPGILGKDTLEYTRFAVNERKREEETEEGSPKKLITGRPKDSKLLRNV